MNAGRQAHRVELGFICLSRMLGSSPSWETALFLRHCFLSWKANSYATTELATYGTRVYLLHADMRTTTNAPVLCIYQLQRLKGFSRVTRQFPTMGPEHALRL